eukprot:scpid59794/ scgid14704/ Ficolin-1; Collagen/fibrinogen domain-containing protein 1; Ficolin-A; Ficolin-alpha; M-ficolin
MARLELVLLALIVIGIASAPVRGAVLRPMRSVIPDTQAPAANGTCMESWLRLHDSTLTFSDAQVKAEVLASYANPIDEVNAHRQRPVLYSFVFGGASKSENFIRCIGRLQERCRSEAPCGDHGQCVYGTVGNTGYREYMCKCTPGYTGRFCEREVLTCARRPCRNGGRCLEQPSGTYRCSCPALWGGQHCTEHLWVSKTDHMSLVGSVMGLENDITAIQTAIKMKADKDWQRTEIFLKGMERRLAKKIDQRLDAIALNVSLTGEKIKALASGLGGNPAQPESSQCLPQSADESRSRIVTHTIGNTSFQALCNMSIDGGGWTVIIRSFGRHATFWNRDWAAYKAGFGYPGDEFWLGNDNMHVLTHSQQYEVRIDLATRNAKHFIKYRWMRLADENGKYQLSISRPVEFSFPVPAGQGLDHHTVPFSTRDRDNDVSGDNCAARYKAAWWYVNCYYVLPHAEWDTRFSPSVTGLTFFEMKVRPIIT